MRRISWRTSLLFHKALEEINSPISYVIIWSKGKLKPGNCFVLAPVLAYLDMRTAACGLLMERLLCCKGADWNQLEIILFYLFFLHSKTGQTPDGAAICFIFILLYWQKDNWHCVERSGEGERVHTLRRCPSWGSYRKEENSPLITGWLKYSPGHIADVTRRNMELDLACMISVGAKNILFMY